MVDSIQKVDDKLHHLVSQFNVVNLVKSKSVKKERVKSKEHPAKDSKKSADPKADPKAEASKSNPHGRWENKNRQKALIEESNTMELLTRKLITI